jgi:integrase
MAKPKPIPAEIGLIRTRVRKDGTVAFRACWDVKEHGEWRQASRTFERLEDAQEHLRGIAKAKREGRYRGPARITVSELVHDYIARSGEAGRISERTVHTYTDRAAKTIDPTIGKKPLDRIAPLDVQQWIDGLTRKGLAPSTVHAAAAVLMGALREAAVLGITDRHLGAGIRRPSLGKSIGVVWTAQEVRTVLANLAGDWRLDALYRVALATGMRPGELRALKWDCVDLDGARVIVARTLTKDAAGRETIADRTKGREDRAIAIEPPVAEALKRHRVMQHERRLASATWHDLNLVFDRGDGMWLGQNTWQKWHAAFCERIGVPKIRLHDLRHTAATLMVRQGIHPEMISTILGHATIAITMDRYSHLSVDDQRSAASRLAAVLFDEAGTGAG